MAQLELHGAPLPVAHHLELHLIARAHRADLVGEDTFRSRARVVFLGPDSERSAQGEERYRVGLAFDEPSESDREIVLRYIADTLEPRRR